MKRKMISKDGVKANCCCASCENNKREDSNTWKKSCVYGIHVPESECCEEYTMERFFKERGYEEIQN